MDAKNLRLMEIYSDVEETLDVLYIDEEAREAVALEWGETVDIIGRRNAQAVIRPMKEEDAGACVARAGKVLREKLMIEIGEEVLINSEV